MMQHQPRYGLGFLRAQPDRRADLGGQLRADLRMVATAALGDVVQQGGGIQRAAGLQILHQLGRDGRDLRHLRIFQHVQHPQRFHRVFVHGEDVIGVELHLADDTRPIGQIAAQDTGLVQHGDPACAIGMGAGVVRRRAANFVRRRAADDIVRRRAAAEQVQEDRRRRRIIAQADCLAFVADHAADRQRVQCQSAIARHLQNAQHLHRLVLERTIGGGHQQALHQHEAQIQQRLVGFRRQRRWAECSARDRRFQHPGQPHHRARGQEVVAHEALHPILTAVAGIADARADHRLHVKRQPILGAAGDVVQVEAHGPEEIPRPSRSACLGHRQQRAAIGTRKAAEIGQRSHVGAEHCARHPV